MDLNKVRKFGELQDAIFNKTGNGNFPFITIYNGKEGVAVRNPFLDVTGRFKVDPIKEYGEEKLEEMDAKIFKIETDLNRQVKNLDLNDLKIYLNAKFYSNKEITTKDLDDIYFEDEIIYVKNGEELVDDTINFYIPLIDGFERFIPNGAIKMLKEGNVGELNFYANYDIPSGDISLEWNYENDGGNVSLSKEAQNIIKDKMDSYAHYLFGKDLSQMIIEDIYEEIKTKIIDAAQELHFCKRDENGIYQIEMYADYNDSNKGLLEGAYQMRESAELKNSIIDEISVAYEDTTWDYASDILKKAGFDVDSSFNDISREILWENISISPDYAHFMNDDVKVNLLLATDAERNVEFTDIKDNLYRQVDKDSFTEMLADSKKWRTEITKPDNALVWLIEQQEYTLDDLKATYEDYRNFIEDNYYPNGNPREKELSYEEKIKVLAEEHGKFLVSVCEALDNQTYSMGCLTVLMKSSLSEYCDLLERDPGTKELVPKNIVIPKDAYLTIHDPWDGAGCMGWIELEKDLVLPNTLIYDSEIEGVKRDYGWTVDEISGLVGSCWKVSKGIQKSERKVPNLDEMIHSAISSKEISKVSDSALDKQVVKDFER